MTFYYNIFVTFTNQELRSYIICTKFCNKSKTIDGTPCIPLIAHTGTELPFANLAA